MTAKERIKARVKIERALTDDEVEAWESENWAEIEAKLEESQADVLAGRVSEFSLEKFVSEILEWKPKSSKRR